MKHSNSCGRTNAYRSVPRRRSPIAQTFRRRIVARWLVAVAAIFVLIRGSQAASFHGILQISEWIFPNGSSQTFERRSGVNSDESFGDSISGWSVIPGATASESYFAAIPHLPDNKRTYSLEYSTDFYGGPNAWIGANVGTWIDDSLLLRYQPAVGDPPLPEGPCKIRYRFHVLVSSLRGAIIHGVYVVVSGNQIAYLSAPTNQIFSTGLIDIPLDTPVGVQFKLGCISYAGGGHPNSVSLRSRMLFAGAEVFDALGNPLDPSKWTLYRVGADGTGLGAPVSNDLPEPAPLTLTIQPTPDQPGQMDLVFWPLSPLANYTVETSPGLSPASWSPLTGATQSDNGAIRTVTDPNASGDTKFYRVVTSPQ